MAPPELSAVILAAGFSTRMGCDKALLDRHGIPWWQHQRAVLVQAGAGEIFISARPEQRWASGEIVVPDAVTGAGPLAGIVAALERAACDHLAVLAVDLPKMEASWFSALLAMCSCGVGAVGRWEGEGGYFEPLAAVYPREMLGPARAALARGEYSLQRLLSSPEAQRLMRVRVLGTEESALFDNWNEPRR